MELGEWKCEFASCVAQGRERGRVAGMFTHAEVAQLRRDADDRERWLMERIDALHEERDEARTMASAAAKEVATLEKKVEALRGVKLEEEDAGMVEAVAAFKAMPPDALKLPGKRGKARKGPHRAGLPTCKTVPLQYDAVALFKRKGWRCFEDLKRAIARLKVAPGAQPTSEQLSVSSYQARDALLVFSMSGAPWTKGCLVSFLSYMKSKRFENTDARDRKHWMCMKLWPGRFPTPGEYRQHKACMSKAGKFITSVNKLKKLYERDLVERGLIKGKGMA